jgi:hypothetical protein
MPKPGVGYTVPNPISSYVMGTLTSPPKSYAMVLSALPADGHTWVLPRDATAYEKRYGPGTAQFGDTGFKKWVGSPQNELKYIVVEALRWWGTQHPNPAFDGNPNDVEITDVQATNDPIYRAYILTTPGFSPDNPQHVNDAGKPHGPYQEFNPLWGLMNYYFNDHPDPTGLKHPFLAKVPYERMKQAFGKRWAWPLDLTIQKHNLQQEVLAAWIFFLDDQGEANPTFVELKKEFGP